jgi:hypothetical protein
LGKLDGALAKKIPFSWRLKTVQGKRMKHHPGLGVYGGHGATRY